MEKAPSISDTDLIERVSAATIAEHLKIAPQNVYRLLHDLKNERRRKESYFRFERLASLYKGLVQVRDLQKAEFVRSVIRERFSSLIHDVFADDPTALSFANTGSHGQGIEISEIDPASMFQPIIVRQNDTINLPTFSSKK